MPRSKNNKPASKGPISPEEQAARAAATAALLPDANGSTLDAHEKRPIGAQLGSNNAEKFKTPEEREKLFKDLIEHLEGGYDQDVFVPCSWNTVLRYVQMYPEIFDQDRIDQAVRKGGLMWEKRYHEHTTGTTKGGSDSCMIFAMKNKRKWRDRMDLGTDPTSPFQVQIVDDIPR